MPASTRRCLKVFQAICFVMAAGVVVTANAQEPTVAPAYPGTIEGSLPTSRSGLDGYIGSVYIYTGGNFPSFTYPAALQFYFNTLPNGNTSGYITPLLFETETVGQYTVYVVASIAKGYTVSVSSKPQTIPFTILVGDKVTTSSNFTFGFINALVDVKGDPLVASAGTVEYDNPAVGGFGLGGRATSNNWLASESQYTNVELGSTFGVYGSNAANLLFTGYRTYSAFAVGAIVAQ